MKRRSFIARSAAAVGALAGLGAGKQACGLEFDPPIVSDTKGHTLSIACQKCGEVQTTGGDKDIRVVSTGGIWVCERCYKGVEWLRTPFGWQPAFGSVTEKDGT